MSWRERLGDAPTWWALTAEERIAATKEIANALEGDWEARSHVIVHRPTGMEFAVVPGGVARLGLGIADALALATARRRTKFEENRGWVETVTRSRPSRPKTVEPFIVAKHPGPIEPPFRLILERELEWVLRGAGKAPSQFVGVPAAKPLTPKTRRKTLTELHAPLELVGVLDRVQMAVGDAGERVGRECHSQWQDDDAELIGLHVAARVFDREGVSRAVFPLPDVNVQDSAPDEIEAALDLVSQLDVKKTCKVARSALSMLALNPAADLVPLIEPMLSRAERTTAKEATVDLRWLAQASGCMDPFETSGIPENIAVIEANVERCFAFLSHETPAVRAAAAMVLSVCVNRASEVSAVLSERATSEKHAGVLGAIAIAGAILFRDADVQRPSIASKKKLAPVLALADAIAKEPDLDALLAALNAKKLSGLGWFEGDVAAAVRGQIVNLAEGRRDDVAEVLLEANAVEVAVAVAFGDDRPPSRMRLPDELSALQRRLLEMVVDAPGSIPGVPIGRESRAWFLKRRPGGLFDRVVKWGGRSIPLLLALHEVALETSDPQAHLQSVDSLVSILTLDELLALDATTITDWMSLRYTPANGCPKWPYVWPPHLYRKMNAAPLEQRRAFYTNSEPDVVTRLAGHGGVFPSTHPAWVPLARLCACLGPDLPPSPTLLEAVSNIPLASLPDRLVEFLGGAESSLEQSVDSALEVARAFLDGETRKAASVDWVQPSWPMWAVVAILSQELALGFNDTMDALSYENELRHLWKGLPKAARKLYDAEGQPKDDRGFNDPKVRRPVVAELVAFVERTRSNGGG